MVDFMFVNNSKVIYGSWWIADSTQIWKYESSDTLVVMVIIYVTPLPLN